MQNTDINQIEQAEVEAKIFLQYALALAKASTSENESEKLQALDNNLKLWVEIEVALQDTKSLLSDDLKNNLMQLSKFVERLILSKGVKMAKTDFDCLVNINMQISEGLMEAVKNALAREEAFSLLKCALDISTAREKQDDKELVSALDNNLQLWVYIKTLASSHDSKLPADTKSNLIKLADYVSAKTLEIGQNMSSINPKTVDSMIMTNLQISEGLMSRRSA